METTVVGTAPAGRRERNKQRIRKRLYDAALSLFAEQGYDATTIDEIADRADVARGTFFNHFHRKEDLIAEWGEQRRARLKTYLEETVTAGEGQYQHRLECCMGVLGRLNEEEERDVTPAMLRAWVQAGQPLMEEPYAAKIFADVVESGRLSGEFAAGIDAVRVGNALRDTYLGTLYRWARHSGTPSLQDELQEVLKLLLTGIKADAHREGGCVKEA
ncbi:TetR/AcrR family transcriptional regulator [Streptomyces sp. NPDC001135]